MTTPNKDREAFERTIAQHKSNGTIKNEDGDYLWPSTQLAWLVYQAACAEKDKVLDEIKSTAVGVPYVNSAWLINIIKKTQGV
jgi:hypothetical protein